MTIARPLHHGMLLLLLLATTAMAAVAADAGSNRTSCVAEEERLELLRLRLGTQERTRELLQALRSGEARPGTTLAQLFVVNLADEEAVRRRVEELAAGDGRRADDEAVTGCRRLATEFDTVVTGLRTVQADVSVMRLAVLRLPATRRALVAKAHELVIDLELLYRSEAERLPELDAQPEEAASPPAPGETETAAGEGTTTTVEVDLAAMAAFRETHGRVTALRNQATRLLAVAQRADDGTTSRQQAAVLAQQTAVLALWREILDHPLHLTTLPGSGQSWSFSGDDLQTRQLGDERQRALLQARL